MGHNQPPKMSITPFQKSGGLVGDNWGKAVTSPPQSPIPRGLWGLLGATWGLRPVARVSEPGTAVIGLHKIVLGVRLHLLQPVWLIR